MKEKSHRKNHWNKKRIFKIILILAVIILGRTVYRTYMDDMAYGQRTMPSISYIRKHGTDTSREWNLILVNRSYYVPKDYKVSLTKLSNGKKVDSRIYPQLQQMFNAARAAGLSLFVREGYRTKEQQQKIMNEYIQRYQNQGYSRSQAQKMAKEYVAIPGTSEHQLGLGVDINADKKKCPAIKVYRWLNQNAYRYGFVKRYPSDKIDITGISNEPWHYRYVGTKAARIMKEENLCLEEYVKRYQ